jgi:hypothetical protein
MQTELVGGYATRENLAAPFLTTSGIYVSGKPIRTAGHSAVMPEK